MQARIENPAMLLPGALEAFQQLAASATNAGIPETTLQMMELRARQINGCSGFVDIHSRALERLGRKQRAHPPDRGVAGRAVFQRRRACRAAPAEAATRIADRPDPVSDEVWDEASRHYTEGQLAALVVAIATITAYNRANVVTRDHRRVDRSDRSARRQTRGSRSLRPAPATRTSGHWRDQEPLASTNLAPILLNNCGIRRAAGLRGTMVAPVQSSGRAPCPLTPWLR
jgi:AhpD family alkylhydroperoxidase